MDEILRLLNSLFSFAYWLFTTFAELVYIFLDLFPDVIKWIALIFIAFTSIVFFFLKQNPILGKVVASSILFLMGRAYVVKENIAFDNVGVGLLNVPVNIFNYFYDSPFYLVLGAFFVFAIYQGIFNSDESENSSGEILSPNRPFCNHDWGEWYQVCGNDSYRGTPIYRKRRCNKCGEVDF